MDLRGKSKIERIREEIRKEKFVRKLIGYTKLLKIKKNFNDQ